MKLKKIIVAVSLEEGTQKPFEFLKMMPIPADAQIELVHLVSETVYAEEMQLSVLRYPTMEDRPKIEKEVTKNLLQLKKLIFPDHAHVTTKIMFDINVKAAFADYAESQKADLVVVATRGKHGIKALFDSSFAQYQLKHSPVNVLVLR